MSTFSKLELNYEHGFLQTATIPLLLILLMALAGFHKYAQKVHSRIALQSKLDICSVERSVHKKRVLQSLVKTNKVLQTTSQAIYLLRGGQLLTGPIGKLAGQLGETVLLRINHSTALAQDILIHTEQMKEISDLLCTNTPYAQEKALCYQHPAIKNAVLRTRSLFPDVRTPLLHKSNTGPLFSIHCRSLNMSTKISLSGNPLLTDNSFKEKYER